jgi:hypothetical protein
MFKKVIVAVALLLVCFTVKTQTQAQAEDSLKLENVSVHVGNHILSSAPSGISGTQFEYGIETEFNVRHWKNWRIAASISRSSSSGSEAFKESSSSCTTVSAVHYNDDYMPLPTSHTVCTTADSVYYSSSSLDLLTLDLGIKRHWHLHKHLETSVGLGLNHVNADFHSGGRSDTNSTLGVFVSTGIQLEHKTYLFGVDLKASTDPVTLNGNRVDVGGTSIMVLAGKSF